MSKSTDELSKLLLNKKRNGFFVADEKTITKADEFTVDYKTYLNAAKTEREATTYAQCAAEKKGFVPFDFKASYKAGDKVYMNNRGKSICLAIIGKKGVSEGVRIVAAHIDSPRIDAKPIPLYESHDLVMMKTRYYGGIKKYQWVGMPLAMHGVIVKKDGTVIQVRVGEETGEPQFCITDLLPHLGQEQGKKTLGDAFSGEDHLNVLVGSRPIRDEKAENIYKLNVLRILNEKYGVVEADLISAELEFVPAFQASDIGFDRALIGAYGHDDRVCAYPATEALFDCGIPEHTCITVLTDKEETGSEGNTGLCCDYLRYFIADLAQQEGLEPRHVLTKSACLSADVTAAFDPNYAYAFDQKNVCYINNGVGFSKYTGGRSKGGTSDANAEFIGKIRKIFDDAGVVWQIGELGKVDLGGGGTVAKLIADMNVEVIDLGVPVLSMHAPFEVISKLDIFMAYKAFKAFFKAK